MLLDYFKLALGNLKHRGLRSWLTMLGIFIGIAAVVALISLGSALEYAITGQFGDLGTDKLNLFNCDNDYAVNFEDINKVIHGLIDGHHRRDSIGDGWLVSAIKSPSMLSSSSPTGVSRLVVS